MKNLIALLLLGFSVLAQEKESTHSYELRTNVLGLISQGNYNLSAEKFASKTWSYGLSIGTTQSAKQKSNFDEGNNRHLAQWELTPFVRVRLSKSNRSYYFAEAFSSINQGQYKAVIRQTDTPGNAYYLVSKGNYTDLALGGSLGYKLLLKSVIPVEFLVGFGSNILHPQQSPAVVSRVGLSVGYQF